MTMWIQKQKKEKHIGFWIQLFN